MELQLALTLSTNISFSCKNEAKEIKNQVWNMKKIKRSYEEAFDHEVNSTNHNDNDNDNDNDNVDDDVPQTLSLFVWKPNGDDDPNEDETTLHNHSIHFNKNDEDEDGIIGWPPINSWRTRLCQIGGGGRTINYVRVENRGIRRYVERGEGGGSINNNSMFVKVKMEGVGIARKVDLSLHHSFQTLTHTLFAMFGKDQENVQAYKLAYQDKGGDWLLAQDVPWGTFLQSVQRLLLLKNGE